MAQDARAFLRSQGFSVGKRGRFSSEMLACLVENGYIEDKNVKIRHGRATERVNEGIKPTVNVPVRRVSTIVERPVMREVSFMHAVDSNGIRVQFAHCHKCTQHISRCYCSVPTPPYASVFVLDDSPVMV